MLAAKIQNDFPDRDLIERRIRHIFEARAAGDVSPTGEYTAEDVIVRFDNWRGAPGRLVFKGKAEASAGMRELNILIENFGSRINSLVIDGERGALCRTARVRNRGTGATVELEICDFFVFRDGLIIQWDEYVDTVGLRRLVMQDPLI